MVDISDPSSPFVVRRIDQGGSSRAVQRLGETLFVKADSGVLLYDLALPADPVLLANVEPEEGAITFAAAGHFLYVSTSDWNFQVYDISVPSAPELLATVATDHKVAEIAIWGNHAYLAHADFTVVDISEPSQPQMVGTLDIPGLAQGMAPTDSLVYLAANHSEVLVIHVGDPTNPTIAGTGPIPSEAEDALVLESLLLVADAEWGSQVFDRSNPLQPQPIAAFDTPVYATGVATSPGLILVADSGGGLQIIDPAVPIATPIVAAPVLNDVEDVAIQDDLAYAASGDSGLVILDVSTPSLPIELGRLRNPEGVGAIAVAESIACLGAQGSLFTVDIVDPTAPRVLGFTHTLAYEVTDVEVRDGFAYLTIAFSPARKGLGDGLEIVDISIPAEPFVVATLVLPAGASALTIVGDIACIAAGQSGLHTINIADPYSPELLGRYDMGSARANGVSVSGDHAYVACGSRGLEVLNIQNPRQLTSVALVELPAWAQSVEVRDRVAYLTAAQWGIHVFDVRVPSHPRIIGVQDTPGWADRLQIAGDHVYVCNSFGGLIIAERQCDLILTNHPPEIGFSGSAKTNAENRTSPQLPN